MNDFKVNDYITLKLENNKTVIYICYKYFDKKSFKASFTSGVI